MPGPSICPADKHHHEEALPKVLAIGHTPKMFVEFCTVVMDRQGRDRPARDRSPKPKANPSQKARSPSRSISFFYPYMCIAQR